MLGSFGYEWLCYMVWVQSVTWAAMVGCPFDRWWLVLSCSPSYPSVNGWVTLTFDSSPIKGEGILLTATLWFDESPITLCQRARL